MRRHILIYLALVLGSGATAVIAVEPSGGKIVGGDVEGEVVYERCATCHLPFDESTSSGPSLYGVVGRKAAILSDFRYSDAMKAAGAAGKVWDDAALDEYLAAPTTVVPGTSMKTRPLEGAQDRADVIAYLRTLVPMQKSVATPAQPGESATTTPSSTLKPH